MKFLLGKGGYLFLDNDTNGTISQMRGMHNIGGQFCAKVAARHEARVAALDNIEATYNHIVVPNKETVLVDRLPDGITYEESGPTPLTVYMNHLDRRSRFRKIDLRSRTFFSPEILDSFCEGGSAAFYRTDTHWNYEAAGVYFREAAVAFGWRDVVDSYDQLAFEHQQRSFLGDLGIIAAAEPEVISERRVQQSTHETLFAGNIPNEGYVRHTRTARTNAVQKKVMVIHDSFTQWLWPVMSEIFREVLYIHTPDLDVSFVEDLGPDALIFIQVERFFPRVVSNEINLVEMLGKKAQEKSVDASTSEYIRRIESINKLDGAN